MKFHHKLTLLLLIGFFAHTSITAQNKVKTFASLGTTGIGLGLKYKNTTLYTKYFYEYWESASEGRFYYLHSPTIGVTYNIINEKYANLYIGLDYRLKFFTQKYFFPGTVRTDNFFISVPLGVEIKPFKTMQNISILVETGLELEHYWWDNKGYSWNLNLWRGVIEIRYQFGKRIRI